MTELIVFGEHTTETAVYYRRRVFHRRGKKFVIKQALWSFGCAWSHVGSELDQLLAEDGLLEEVATIAMGQISAMRGTP